MKLYVMRHGTAEDDSPSGQDFDRALTAKGRERVREVAKKLADADEAPLLVLSSPLVRAVQTAEVVALTTELSASDGTVEIRRELAPGGDHLACVEKHHAKGQKRLMVVGHEPDLSAFVTTLLGEPMPMAMQKAMVVGLMLGKHRGEPAKLRFILDPKELRWAMDAR